MDSVCFVLFLFPLRGLATTMVANEGLGAYLNQVPQDRWLRRMQCKLQVKTLSEYTYSLFWAEPS